MPTEWAASQLPHGRTGGGPNAPCSSLLSVTSILCRTHEAHSLRPAVTLALAREQRVLLDAVPGLKGTNIGWERVTQVTRCWGDTGHLSREGMVRPDRRFCERLLLALRWQVHKCPRPCDLGHVLRPVSWTILAGQPAGTPTPLGGSPSGQPCLLALCTDKQLKCIPVHLSRK